MIKVYAQAEVLVKEVSIFSFDDYSIPFKDNLFLTLNQVEKYEGNPVLRKGREGSHEESGVSLYGSVYYIDNKFRMWYLGYKYDLNSSPPVSLRGYLCYAESDDGIHWDKPNLGLVEYNGSYDNNIALIEPQDCPYKVEDDVCVLYDPEDPDPNRRYKLAYDTFALGKDLEKQIVQCGNVPTMMCAISPDGLRWQLTQTSPPIREHFEVHTLYKFKGWYYAAGQQVYPQA